MRPLLLLPPRAVGSLAPRAAITQCTALALVSFLHLFLSPVTLKGWPTPGLWRGRRFADSRSRCRPPDETMGCENQTNPNLAGILVNLAIATDKGAAGRLPNKATAANTEQTQSPQECS
jgi:hypothetical protein